MLRQIPSYPSYYAGSDGHIYRDGKRISSRCNGRGYLQVTLSQDGVIYTRYAHRLVCEAFHGPCPPDKQETRHLDNDRGNNRPENLKWSTKKENEADKVKFGTLLRGEKMSHAVLTEGMVMEARKRAKQGERMDLIARDFGINPRVMADAITGRRWGWLPGAVPAFHTRRKLTEDQVREIRSLFGKMTHVEIATRFSVSRQAITQISTGKSYSHVE